MPTARPAPHRGRTRHRARRLALAGAGLALVLAAPGSAGAAGGAPSGPSGDPSGGASGDATSRAAWPWAAALQAPGAGVLPGGGADGAVAPHGAGTSDAGGAAVLPVDGAVVALFRAPAQRWSAGHRGVDLDAAPGTAVRAPAAGVVTFSGTVVDRGVLVVTHPDGTRSSLEPVVEGVAVGAVVAAGDPVGRVGPAGSHCPTSCLHWGVRVGELYVDPLGLLPGAGPVVLLPPA